MTGAFGKCSKIRHIVRLRQMLRRWRARAAAAAPSRRAAAVPADVPAGHVAVCVGTNSRRFVVRTAHLSHPSFRALLAEAEQEYGFSRPGPLAIPCDEAHFEELLRRLHGNKLPLSTSCSHAGALSGWQEVRPLLQGIYEKSAAW